MGPLSLLISKSPYIISVLISSFVFVGRTRCQFLVSTNLTWSDRGWPGYSHPESEASGAQGGRCSLLPAGQVRALECTVPLRQHGPECLELAVEKVGRWLYSAARQVSNVYLKIYTRVSWGFFYILFHTNHLFIIVGEKVI